MNIEKTCIKKILLINLKYLGDLIVCSPAYRSLREYFPDAEITIIVRKGYKSIFDFDANIDNVVEFDLNSERKLSGLERVRSSFRFIKELRSQNYDLVITFHPTDRLAIWSFFSGAKYRVGYEDQSFHYLFNYNIHSIEESKSYLEYYLDALRRVGIPINDKATYLKINSENEEEAQSYFLDNFSENNIVIGIHPGASRNEKIWDPENYSILANKLSEEKLPVLIFQGPDDKQVVEKIKKGLDSERIKIVDTSKNILYLAALIKHCSVLICNDSGSSHIARALNVKTITLMSREKKHCWQIYSESDGHHYLFGDICRECISAGCLGNMCLKNISVETVQNKILEIINA